MEPPALRCAVNSLIYGLTEHAIAALDAAGVELRFDFAVAIPSRMPSALRASRHH
jgi:hypothetical protein